MGASVQELAGEAAACFETAERVPAVEGVEPETFVRVREGSPAWVGDLVREAHRDSSGAPAMLPDDWRYRTIEAALEYIGELGLEVEPQEESYDFADATVDVYNAARLEWLGSKLWRAGYCDQARDNGAEGGVFELIGAGQYEEAREVYELVLEQLEARRDELEAAELFGEVQS